MADGNENEAKFRILPRHVVEEFVRVLWHLRGGKRGGYRENGNSQRSAFHDDSCLHNVVKGCRRGQTAG